MKKFILILLTLLLYSCSVNTSSNIDVDTGDIKYVKDHRTGLCFGIVAWGSTTGLGLTCVPCENVEKLIE